jgi:hypothetical protein
LVLALMGFDASLCVSVRAWAAAAWCCRCALTV